MILDISRLCSVENCEKTEVVHLDMESFASKLGVFPIIKQQPFELHFFNEENKRLRIRGEMDVTIAIPCDRCLKEVPTDFHIVIDKKLSLSDALASEKEDILEQREYVDGYQLDVDRIVYGEILVAWPMKVLCRKDCKGICKKCGADLNEGACGCDQFVPDPRMAAFQDVFNKFKEV